MYQYGTVRLDLFCDLGVVVMPRLLDLLGCTFFIPMRLKVKSLMNIIKSQTVAFTGNRKLSSPNPKLAGNLDKRIRDSLYIIIEKLYLDGKRCFLNGGAVGFDLLSAEVVLALREQHPEIILIIVIPFRGQEKSYSDTDKIRYRRILELADDTVVIWNGGYSTLAYHKRNDFLIANASYIITYSNGIGKGTVSTIKKAIISGLDIFDMYQALQKE